MEIVKKNNILELKENNITIEEYDFSNEINFSKLMDFLLDKNLKEKIQFNPQIEDFEENDANLINIIKDIISKYNDIVDEFNRFVINYNNK